jgi:hypothetical protein
MQVAEYERHVIVDPWQFRQVATFSDSEQFAFQWRDAARRHHDAHRHHHQRHNDTVHHGNVLVQYGSATTRQPIGDECLGEDEREGGWLVGVLRWEEGNGEREREREKEAQF